MNNFEKRGSRFGVVLITFSENPTKHLFKFVDLDDEPVVFATDIYAAEHKLLNLESHA